MNRSVRVIQKQKRSGVGIPIRKSAQKMVCLQNARSSAKTKCASPQLGAGRTNTANSKRRAKRPTKKQILRPQRLHPRSKMEGFNVLTREDSRNRAYWLKEIQKLSGNFGSDSSRLDAELEAEINRDGTAALLTHLRLCGAIPESYGHDSSEEKLYSKYTDSLLCQAFQKIGLRSLVLQERADSADVEAFAPRYSLVADAKAFRLSRTAKNQKDFKVEAMHSWKKGKPHAVVVCPVYQLPTRASQIYQQAISREVCIFTYSHLSVLVRLAEVAGHTVAIKGLKAVFDAIASINPSKDANSYWQAVNTALLNTNPAVANLWRDEKLASLDSIKFAKIEALTEIAQERERIMRMSHKDALAELVSKHNLDGREAIIRAVSDTGILTIR